MTTVALDSLFKAQFGEDRILWQVFRQRTHGFFIEIGAYDGVAISNTFFLEQMGWHGLLIEPIAPLCEKAVRARPRSRVVNAAVGRRGSCGSAAFTITKNVPVLSFLKTDDDHVARCRQEGAEFVRVNVPLTTVTDILLKGRNSGEGVGNAWVPNRGWCIDLVSIDTEGMELDVLDGFDLERFKPRVLIVENDRPSGNAIEPYLSSRGYHKFHRQKINDFYVRRAADNSDLTLVDLVTAS